MGRKNTQNIKSRDDGSVVETEAYSRIDGVTLNTDSIVTTFGWYFSEEAHTNKADPLGQTRFVIGADPAPLSPAVFAPDGSIVKPETPAIPSYQQVRDSPVEAGFAPQTNGEIMDYVKRLLYLLTDDLPENTGSVQV